MDKKIKIMFCVLFSAFLFSSCFYIVSDRPYYYTDYEDPETSASYNYYYSYSYTHNAAIVPTFTPTPVPTPVITKQTNIFIVLKVIDNRHVFYRNNREIAVWYFHPNGRIERKGEDINGKVIRYYDNSDIIEWEFEYKNNVRWGQCRRYFNDGKIWEDVYYNQGKRQGPYKLYHPNGKIKEEVKYKDGFRDGIYRIYHEDGKIIEHGNYKGNKKEVKFRDEKYFKDKRDEVVPEPTRQIKVQQTPTAMPTIDIKQYENKGLKIQKETPEVKNKYGYKIKDENENKEKGDDEGKDKAKEEDKGIGKADNIKQKQQIVEKEVDAGLLTGDAQTKSKFLKTKKQKDIKQQKKYYGIDEKIKDNNIKGKQNYQEVTGKATEYNKDEDKDEDKDKEKGKYKSKEKIWGKEKDKN